VLLTPNHVSFVDALMLIASLDRPVRFIVDQSYFDYWLFRPFMKSMGNIPISSSGAPRVLLQALREAGQYLDAGEEVRIFPEGQITRIGAFFRRGFERITRNREAPIVPVYLDRLWGSIFSRSGGRFLLKIPKRIPYPVTVAFGAPMSSETSVAEIRQQVQELASSAWAARRKAAEPLQHAFIRQVRRWPFALAFADALRPNVSRLKGTHRSSRASEGAPECLEGPDPSGDSPASQRRGFPGQSRRFSFWRSERQSELYRRPLRNGVHDPSG